MLWEKRAGLLKHYYNDWGLSWDIGCPAEVKLLRRHQLHRYNAVRHGHGDFAWYHRRWRHEDANLHCRCSARKTPTHIFLCTYALSRFDNWPWPWDEEEVPRNKPATRQEKDRYMWQVMTDPGAFASCSRRSGSTGDLSAVRRATEDRGSGPQKHHTFLCPFICTGRAGTALAARRTTDNRTGGSEVIAANLVIGRVALIVSRIEAAATEQALFLVYVSYP